MSAAEEIERARHPHEQGGPHRQAVDEVLVLPADPNAPIPLVPTQPLTLDESVRLHQLPAEVRDLLQAVHDSLDVPRADDFKDNATRNRLLDERAGDTLIMLTAVLRGDRITDVAKQLTGWTAERPVTYPVYEADRDGDR